MLGSNRLVELDGSGTHCFVNPWLAKKATNVGFKMEPVSLQVQTANGTVHVDCAVHVPLEWNNKYHIQKCLVMPNMGPNLVLGRQFFEEAGVYPDFLRGGWFEREHPETLHLFERGTQISCYLLNCADFAQSACAHMLANKSCTAEAHQNMNEVVKWFHKRGLFSEKPGLVKTIQHTIPTGEHKPHRANPRPLSKAKKEILDQILNKLLDDKIIEPCQSEWASSPVLVEEKTEKGTPGKWHLCHDYRVLNTKSEVQPHPMPKLDYIFTQLCRAKVFTVLDLSLGYHQIVINPEDKHKTAFITTHRGSFQYRKMPFGLKGACYTFQATVEKVLEESLYKYSMCFLGDIVVYSESWEQHVEHLSDVLTKLHCANFTVNPKKIKIGCDTINLLGHVVEQGQIRPDPERVAALQDYPQPKNVKGIQRFLGAIGLYSSYVPHFSILSEPLTRLLGKDVPWNWGESQDTAFHLLKAAVLNDACLALPDMDRPFVLQCNASASGLSVTLSQMGDEGLRPIHFASRQLKSAETYYCDHELQCLSVMFAVHKFLPYVEHAHSLIETDLRAVKEVLSLRETSGRVKRWQKRLMGIDRDIVDRKCNANTVALRAVKIPTIPDITYTNKTELVKILKPELSLVEHEEIPVTAGEWWEAQEKDPELSAIIDLVLAEDSHILASKYFVDTDDVLKRQNISGSPQIVVPKLCRNAIIKSNHTLSLSEHFDVSKTYNKVKEKFTWKHMRANVKHYVKRCELCGSSKQEPSNVTHRSEESVFLSSRGTHSHYCY